MTPGRDELLARGWLRRNETGARARDSLAALIARVRREARRDAEIQPGLDELRKALTAIVRTRPTCPLGPLEAVVCPRRHAPRKPR
jgi:uncharacterized protein with von Willebrand factor type A (vWA) domain